MSDPQFPRMARLNGAFKGRGRNYLTLLVCPVDGAALAHEGDALVCTRQPDHGYRFEDGILRLAAPDQRADLDAISAAHEAQCAAQGWSTPDEAAFKSLPQTGLDGYPES
ncbi:MAG: hypothetical protein JW910_20795, partial [Anaerolineae bacterium]|nr:hypothetical protein [Anaerolineae bacterium]